MKKKVLAATASVAIAATMMTIGSTSAFAAPIKVEDNASQMGTQQVQVQGQQLFLGDIVDGVKNVAGALGRVAEAVKDQVAGTVEAALRGPGVEDLKGIAVHQAVNAVGDGYGLATGAVDGSLGTKAATGLYSAVTKANSGGK
ncbi:hypothetical protein [Bacillus thuringiensis]|uniref:hypothetical protein n=1 Tax=Bacillus thuringiensis TaxID=1428 RepID=UPI000BFE3AC8|nr:hypothetical protein [Bacillus thuringiensis]EKS8373845.1 hypothetical protein [Bacillus cereus]MED3391814.1 hypothetical protein [Bacillus thuringiensis]PGO19424.1 hypothetical protein CN979_31980 [Bacillus thuringiensis]